MRYSSTEGTWSRNILPPQALQDGARLAGHPAGLGARQEAEDSDRGRGGDSEREGVGTFGDDELLHLKRARMPHHRHSAAIGGAVRIPCRCAPASHAGRRPSLHAAPRRRWPSDTAAFPEPARARAPVDSGPASRAPQKAVKGLCDHRDRPRTVQALLACTPGPIQC